MPWGSVTASHIAAGSVVAATDIQQMNTNLNFVGNLKRDSAFIKNLTDGKELWPIAQTGVSFSGGTTISNTTITVLKWTTGDWNQITAWDSDSAANFKISFFTTGFYLIMAYANWDSSATGARRLYLDYVDSGGTTEIDRGWENALTDLRQRCATIYYVNEVNAYTQARVWQNSGGDVTLDNGWLRVAKIGAVV